MKMLLTMCLCRPLDEAKKVKDKFDDIFNTTRYVKCQSEIHKEIAQERNGNHLLKHPATIL